MTEQTRLNQTLIGDLPETSLILRLLKEIALAAQYPLEPFYGSMVIHYLTDLRARRPISKKSIDGTFFLESPLLKQKISKLHDTEIYWLCHEIAQMNRSGVEAHGGTTLYVFLDQQLKNSRKRRAKPILPGYLMP